MRIRSKWLDFCLFYVSGSPCVVVVGISQSLNSSPDNKNSSAFVAAAAAAATVAQFNYSTIEPDNRDGMEEATKNLEIPHHTRSSSSLL